MNIELKQLVERFQKKEPTTFNACYPRRITPPGGYTNPKFFGATLRAELEEAFNDEVNMLAHLTGILHCYKHLSLGVPTYFVRSEFAQAVAQTKPPEDFLLSEIKWPLDALLFCLPTSFAIKTFGYEVPFISVAKVPKGTYPTDVKLPDLDQPSWMLGKVYNEVDRLTIIYPLYGTNDMPVEYTGAFNLTQNVRDIKTAQFEDATYYEERANPENFADYDRSNQPQGEQETEFQNKVISFAIKLMLAVTARPGVIQQGAMTRKPSIIKQKHAKVRDGLWSPNTIGWEYRAQRSASTPGGGTHASPRFHWRMGHWHTVLSGPMLDKETGRRLDSKERQSRLDWFEPVLVNLEAE